MIYFSYNPVVNIDLSKMIDLVIICYDKINYVIYNVENTNMNLVLVFMTQYILIMNQLLNAYLVYIM